MGAHTRVIKDAQEPIRPSSAEVRLLDPVEQLKLHWRDSQLGRVPAQQGRHSAKAKGGPRVLSVVWSGIPSALHRQTHGEASHTSKLIVKDKGVCPQATAPTPMTPNGHGAFTMLLVAIIFAMKMFHGPFIASIIAIIYR